MKKGFLTLMAIASMYLASPAQNIYSEKHFNGFDVKRSTIRTTIIDDKAKPFLEEIGKDTLYDNQRYNDALHDDIQMWLKIFTTDENLYVAFSKENYHVLEVDSIEWQKSKIEQERWDKRKLDELHRKYANSPAPKKASERKVAFLYGRKQLTLDAIKKILPLSNYYLERFKEEGLEPSLLLTSIAESNFNPFAISWAGAGGIFQFTKGTGREYGLITSPYRNREGHYLYDFRRDYILAFEAFLRYHNKAKMKFKDRPGLALVSYNVGMNRDAIEDTTREETDIIKSLGFAPRSYLPEQISLIKIIKNFSEYYPDETLNFKKLDIFKIKRSFSASQLEKELGISSGEIAMHNPQYTEEFFRTPGYKVMQGRYLILPEHKVKILNPQSRNILQKVYK